MFKLGDNGFLDIITLFLQRVRGCWFRRCIRLWPFNPFVDPSLYCNVSASVKLSYDDRKKHEVTKAVEFVCVTMTRLLSERPCWDTWDTDENILYYCPWDTEEEKMQYYILGYLRYTGEILLSFDTLFWPCMTPNILLSYFCWIHFSCQV